MILAFVSAIAVAALAGIAILWRSSRDLNERANESARVAELLREQAQEAQRRERAAVSQLEAILSASGDGILLVDPAGNCRQLNAQARALFGEHPAPSSVLAVTQSAELDGLVAAARSASYRSTEPLAGEVILRSSGDLVIEVLISRIAGVETPPSQSPSATSSFLILLRDITDLRRLETVRRDFVANVSHELRTPLSSVKAVAETLLDGALEDPEVARHFLETIVAESDRLVRIADDLLDLSRVETRPVIKMEHDLAMIVDDVAIKLSSQCAKAGVSIAFDMDRPLIVSLNADEISQVMFNLLDNAIKYTPRGGNIVVGAHLHRARVVVEVADTGIGILQQDLPRLFERFYRADKARSRQSGGTGLGLSIVKHIVERHGGEVWVRSEYNRGSTFGFSLPRSTPENSLNIRFERLNHAQTAAPTEPPLTASAAQSSDRSRMAT